MYFELLSLWDFFTSQYSLCANVFTIAWTTVFRSECVIPQFAGRCKQDNNQESNCEEAGRLRFHKYGFYD